MADVVPEAANYTLRLTCSRRTAKAWGNKESKTHIQLTIRFPSAQFADLLDRHLMRVQDDKKNLVFSTETVKLDKSKVSITLPTSVKEIEADAKGITLTFEKKEEVTAWQKYSKIWSPGPDGKRLSICYDWTHRELSEAVGLPPK